MLVNGSGPVHPFADPALVLGLAVSPEIDFDRAVGADTLNDERLLKLILRADTPLIPVIIAGNP